MYPSAGKHNNFHPIPHPFPPMKHHPHPNKIPTNHPAHQNSQMCLITRMNGMMMMKTVKKITSIALLSHCFQVGNPQFRTILIICRCLQITWTQIHHLLCLPTTFANAPGLHRKLSNSQTLVQVNPSDRSIQPTTLMPRGSEKALIQTHIALSPQRSIGKWQSGLSFEVQVQPRLQIC